jgi:drug/metabolite transporter (DMT)-like permease
MLGLAASVCWGVGDYLGGSQAKVLPGALVVFLSQAVGLIVVAAVAIAGGLDLVAPDLFAAAVAGVASGLGVTAFYKALAIGPMSVVAPISATGVIVPVAVGIVDGDQLTRLQVAGIATAVVGVGVAVAVGVGDEDPGRRRVERLGIVLAVVGAALIGISLAAFDRAAASGALEAVLWARVASVSILGILCLAVRPGAAGFGTQVPALLAIGLLDVFGTLLYTTATESGFLSIVAITASLYPVTTILLARSLLRERLPPVQAGAILAALAGIAAIVAG